MSTAVVYGACLVIGVAMGWVAGVEFHRWRMSRGYMSRMRRAAELLEQRVKERE